MPPPLGRFGAQDASPKPVRITTLSLSDYRNYASVTLTTGAAQVVLTGPNGSGKTNILEALSLLSPGRGLRRASYGDMGRRGTLGAWTVFARLTRGGTVVGLVGDANDGLGGGAGGRDGGGGAADGGHGQGVDGAVGEWADRGAYGTAGGRFGPEGIGDGAGMDGIDGDGGINNFPADGGSISATGERGAFGALPAGLGPGIGDGSGLGARGHVIGGVVGGVIGGDEHAVGTGIAPATTSRQVRIDGDDAKLDDLTRLVRVLWLTPAMDGLFPGPASDRRRFLDRMVLALTPDHGRHVNAYERAMRQRNKMFEGGVRDPAWFEAVEREMASHGAAIATARVQLVLKLNGAQATRAADGADFPQAVLALTGDEGDGDASEFAARLGARRDTDRAAGRALAGPHRVDLTVTHLEKQMPAALASTGEQKALLIGMVLGHAALVARLTGETPILLLDEVAAHLDPSRRAALYTTLDRLGTQTFMTGTDPSLFEALGPTADRFAVAASRIVRV